MGYTKCYISFYFEFQEAGYEGNQYVRILDSSGNVLKTEKYLLDETLHTDTVDVEVALDKLLYKNAILVQFNADGYGKDDWYVKQYHMKIKYYKG